MKETMKKLIKVFLICHFLISVAIGACGMLLGPDTRLGYRDMFVPALMAFLCTLPTLLTLQPEKLTIKQIVRRKILQVLTVEAIVLSMTAKERSNPNLLNPSRRRRIAAGCGRPLMEVNKLIKNFSEMRKMMSGKGKMGAMMKQMASMKGKGGKVPGFPGMGGGLGGLKGLGGLGGGLGGLFGGRR